MAEREPEDRLAQPHATSALVAAIFGSGMAFVDGTVVNVATATLQTNFSATVAQVQWVVEAYALTLSALLLLGGRLGDVYGRKRVFIWGNVLFAASSLLCAISGSLVELVIARGVQGVAAALLIPGSLAIITSAYPASGRARAIGIWSGATAVMGAIALVGVLSSRRRQAIPALAATVLVLMVVTPQLAVDVGLALSVVATAALVVIAPIWSRRLVAAGWPKPL